MHQSANSTCAGKRSDEELANLAKRIGTPLYIYDLGRLRNRIIELRTTFRQAGAKLFFATMANDRLQVLRLLARYGVGACVNSLPHLQLARKAGFHTSAIQFTSTGMTRADMKVAQDLGVRVNLDSLQQLETWLALGASEAGIRINAASLGRNGRADRIGMDASELHLAQGIAKHYRSKITGLHIYVGTNFQTPDQMLPTLNAFFDLAGALVSIAYINIGGGIGVNYAHRGPAFDLPAFGKGLATCANKLRSRLGRNVEIIVEPGRYFVADCAVFLTTVTDRKRLAGKDIAAVDGSVSVFPRPFHHPDTPHQIRPLTRPGQNGHRRRKMLVVGRTTFSRDILGSSLLPSNLRSGDLIVISDAGAYSASMASRFLGQPEPHEIFL